MGLKETAVKSATWKALENSVSQFLSFIVFLVLARILNPEVYGLIALAGIFTLSLTTLCAFGFEQTVIKLEKLTPQDLSSIFYLSCILSISMYLLLVLGSAAIAEVFSEPELQDILPWLGLCVIFNSICAIPRGILRRNFMFKYLALRSIAGIAAGGAVGVWMALAGYNAWALVGQQLAMSVSYTIILFASCRWLPTKEFSWRSIIDTMSFSANVLGAQFMNIATRQADNILIGFFLGSTVLGIYRIGYKIFDTATHVILGSLSAIAFPAFARVMGDHEKMRAAYYSMVVKSTAITLPCFLLLILLSEQLVPTIFGEQWSGSGVVLQYLTIAACINCITYFNSAFFLALGRARTIFRLEIINTGLNIIAFLVAVRWGIAAVAAAFAIRAIITFPLSMFFLQRFASISFASLIVKMKGHLAGLVFLASTVIFVGESTSSLDPWLRLTLQLITGGAVYTITLFMLDRALCKQLISLALIATRRSRTNF
jgi:PST family polysaccharide transporter